MKISHKWLQTYFKKPLPSSEEIARLLTFHIFEVEGIEKKTTDDILDVKVLPDRASYCLSHQGIARELAPLLADNAFVPREIVDIEAGDLEAPEVSIEAGDVCDRYSALSIMGVTKTESPEWLRESLESIGQRSINVFADVANFVMYDISEPMHVFDATRSGNELVVRYARQGETITTLDSKEVVLDHDMVVVASNTSPLALAGIKGGKIAETTKLSHHVIVEAAHFDASYIRKTGARVNIKTDSSKRFENNVSATLTTDALKLFVSTLKKIDPEIIVSSITTVGTYTEKQTKLEVSPAFVCQKLGKEISSEEIIKLLNSSGIDARREGALIAVCPDSKRTDLVISEDIVDEVGRLYGYDHIEGVLPRIVSPVVSNKDIAYRNKVRNFLVGKGFDEVQTYTFVGKGEVEVLAPLAPDKQFLRSNLSESLEKKIQDNIYYADLIGVNKIQVFEFGHVWKGGKEVLSLALGIGYKKTPKGVRANDDIKTVRDELLEHLGVKIEILCTVDDSGGIISKAGVAIGMTNNIDGVMEVDFDALIADLPELADSIVIPKIEGKKYKPLSPYPFMVRHVAVFTPKDVPADDVWHVISTHAGDLVVRHELFDVFEKKNKETGEIEKISYGYRLVFQSYEKTLTDEEVGQSMERVYEALKQKGWEIR